MKYSHCLYLLTISVTLFGCVSGGMQRPTQVQTPTLSPPPTSTPMPRPTQTATLKLSATLKPAQAKATITTLLQGPGDCEAPCFWGITPGQTTRSEAINIFNHLGLNLKFTMAEDGKEFYSVIYDFDNGLRITPVLAIQNEIVQSLRLGIIPQTSQMETPRSWLAYSPETLINRYGSPSKADFFVDRGTPAASYAMVMYFETVDLIVEYGGSDNFSKKDALLVCPLTDQFDSVRIWLGENPRHPPLKGVPLEKATSLTVEEFSKLMTGDSVKACINLKEEMFP